MRVPRLSVVSSLLSVPLLAVALHTPPAEAQTLRGSRASVDRIHRQAVNHGLHFYETSDGVLRAVERGRFVRLSGNADYRVHNVRYPYALPEAELFVRRLASQYRAACGEQLVVTSAVRPRSFRLSNSVAKSVHPTGMAIDLRRPTNGRCASWLRRTLLSLDGAGVIEAVEERNPPHFHVAVFPNQYRQYAARRGARPVVAASATTERDEVLGRGESVTYRVRRGDSLWAIARRHGTSVEVLQQANNLRSPRIVAGQTLVIPSTR